MARRWIRPSAWPRATADAACRRLAAAGRGRRHRPAPAARAVPSARGQADRAALHAGLRRAGGARGGIARGLGRDRASAILVPDRPHRALRSLSLRRTFRRCRRTDGPVRRAESGIRQRAVPAAHHARAVRPRHRGRAGGAHRRTPASAHPRPGRGVVAAEARRRPSRHAHDGAARRMRLLRWLGLGLLLAVALVFALGRPIAWTQAALIIWDVAAGGQPTLWQELTDRPNEYPARWSDGEGDVYAPASRVRAGMVLVPGAAVLGRDEPRLQALARTFARAGFVVLVPELPEVRRLALSRLDADRGASAIRQVRQWEPGPPPGVAGRSLAAPAPRLPPPGAP